MIGLSTNVALRLLDRTKDAQLKVISNQVQHKRAIDDFRANVSKITSVKDLMADYKTYSFVMKAFGLEDKIAFKGMMQKMFESDIDDPASLAARNNDTKIKELHIYFGFTDKGKVDDRVTLDEFADYIVKRYVDTQYENKAYDDNENVGTALYARRKIPTLKNWYNVLADTELTKFFRTALNLPSNLASLPVDKQKELLEKKLPFDKLQDPKEVEKLVTRYGALIDIVNPIGAELGLGPNVLNLLGNRVNNIVSIDISQVSLMRMGKFARY